MTTIKVSVPGKIHLLGEHAVVYGKPALLAAINLRLTVSLRKIEKAKKTNPTVGKLKNVVEAVIREKYPTSKIPHYEVSIDSQIPMNSGLGSSAAASAAFCVALLGLLGKKVDISEINELAYLCEKTFNGNPSGGDNATVVYGGFLWYRKESEILKIIQPLSFPINKNIGAFFLFQSGKPTELTKDMVALVKEKRKRSKKRIDDIFANQEQLTRDMLFALKDGDQEALMRIIREGERNLEAIGVVSEKAKKIIRLIEKKGGTAKISGAGGVKDGAGMLLAYHKDSETIKNIGKKNNLEVFEIALGGEGLRRE